MILTPLQHLQRYVGCHPLFAEALRFLQSQEGSGLSVGKHEIDGERLFAIVAEEEGRGTAGAVLEYHRRYIDIQYVVEGPERMGWKPLEECRESRQAYDPSTDLGFFADPPSIWLDVSPGMCVLFFPEDAHAPLAALGKNRKIIMKVAVEG